MLQLRLTKLNVMASLKPAPPAAALSTLLIAAFLTVTPLKPHR